MAAIKRMLRNLSRLHVSNVGCNLSNISHMPSLVERRALGCWSPSGTSGRFAVWFMSDRKRDKMPGGKARQEKATRQFPFQSGRKEIGRWAPHIKFNCVLFLCIFHKQVSFCKRCKIIRFVVQLNDVLHGLNSSETSHQ